MVSEPGGYTPLIKTLVVRIKSPPAPDRCKALEKLLEHTAHILVADKDGWTDMSYNGRALRRSWCRL